MKQQNKYLIIQLPDNAVIDEVNGHKKAYTQFRKLYERLDTLVEALYQSSIYTMQEFENLAREYNTLQIKADILEQYIRKYYPTTNIDAQISWMKSNPTLPVIYENNSETYTPPTPEELETTFWNLLTG